jgi:hypothetical protein
MRSNGITTVFRNFSKPARFIARFSTHFQWSSVGRMLDRDALCFVRGHREDN